jgi:hypothetical protein
MSDVVLTNTRAHEIRLNYEAPDGTIATYNLPSMQTEVVTEEGVAQTKKILVPVKVDAGLFDAMKKKNDKVLQGMLDQGWITVGGSDAPKEVKK